VPLLFLPCPSAVSVGAHLPFLLFLPFPLPRGVVNIMSAINAALDRKSMEEKLLAINQLSINGHYAYHQVYRCDLLGGNHHYH